MAGDAGAPLDPRAAAEYRRRLAELRSELDEATQWNDRGRADRVRGEIEFIDAELRSAFGLGGRSRRGVDVRERVRKAVSNRIRNAIERIAEEHRPLGRHLDQTIRLGAVCSYGSVRTAIWRS